MVRQPHVGSRREFHPRHRPRLLQPGRRNVTYKPPYSIPEVLRLKSEGQTHCEIANRFGISSSRVGQIIRQERERVESAKRAECLRRQIRASHDLSDLDRKLTVDDLFCLLELPPMVCRRFKRSFQWGDVRELSLRQFMDVLLPLVDHPKNFYDVLPAFKIRTIGKKSYAAVNMRLSSLDLGDAFREEWAGRMRRLKEYLVASEGYHKSKSLLHQFGGTNDGP